MFVYYSIGSSLRAFTRENFVQPFIQFLCDAHCYYSASTEVLSAPCVFESSNLYCDVKIHPIKRLVSYSQTALTNTANKQQAESKIKCNIVGSKNGLMTLKYGASCLAQKRKLNSVAAQAVFAKMPEKQYQKAIAKCTPDKRQT